jgi:hypothetical protein
MTQITFNEKTKQGKAFLEFIETLSYVEILHENLVNEPSKSYTSEFVDKIITRTKKLKKSKLTRLNPGDRWGSIL